MPIRDPTSMSSASSVAGTRMNSSSSLAIHSIVAHNRATVVNPLDPAMDANSRTARAKRRTRQSATRWIAILALALGALSLAPSQSPDKALVAHRGASAYAPEHTLAAYRLAVEQGADFVEQDLGVTRDGVLVCLHDDTLERTTNVRELFPGRFVEEEIGGRRRQRWRVRDLTLAENQAAGRGTLVR